MPKVKTYKSEKDVKAEVKRLLDEYNWFWWMPPANAYGKSGISDFNALWSGVFLAIETKFKDNKPTTMQKSFLVSIQSESGVALVVNEKTLGAFEAWLASFQKATAAASRGEEPTHEDGATMLDALHILTADFA